MVNEVERQRQLQNRIKGNYQKIESLQKEIEKLINENEHLEMGLEFSMKGGHFHDSW